MTFGKRLVAIAATAAFVGLGLGPVPALADDPTDYATAKAQIEQAGSELADYQTSLSMSADELEELKGQISQVQSQIDETQAKYDAAKQTLSTRVHDSYTNGGGSLLDVLLGSKDIDQFVSNLYYIASLNRSDMQTLSAAKALSAQLFDQKAELEAKEAAGEEAQRSSAEQASAYQAKVKEVQAAYNALPEDVKQQLASDAQSAASGDVATNDQGIIQDAVLNAVTTVAQADYEDAVASGDTSSLESDAAVQAVVQTSQSNPSYSGAVSRTTGGTTTRATSTSTSSASTTVTASASASSGSSSGATSSTSSSTSSSGSDWLSRATSVLGTPYVWGGTDTSGFDCSGYVNYVYGSSRGRTTYDMMASAQADGTWSTDFSNMQPGDVIITSGGNHVGIYAGNGQMYNSTRPGEGVQLSDLSYFDEVGYIPGSQY